MEFKIKVATNYSKKTFTLRKIYLDGLKAKYRTVVQSEEGFYDMLQNTKKDWEYYINSPECYKVKTYYNKLKN